MRQGAEGEQAAVEWLRANGYLIVERNWRYGRYEIDIIAERFDTLHIIEVKTRKKGSLTSAEDAIDERKCRSSVACGKGIYGHASHTFGAAVRPDSGGNRA